MQFYEFGELNKQTIILIHPSVVMWDYFEYVIAPLQEKYHLVVLALPGYDKKSNEDFTSIEDIAGRIESWCLLNDCSKVTAVYGCSMGGSIVIKLLSNRRLQIDHAIIDGGITPYQLPWIITRFIALKDFLMICMGKIGGIKLLEKAFATDEFSQEDIAYTADVLSFISYRTIWNTFDSCNNYRMPSTVEYDCADVVYWYGDKEIKERKADIDYMKKHFPTVRFVVFENMGHGSMPVYRPRLFIEEITKLIE